MRTCTTWNTKKATTYKEAARGVQEHPNIRERNVDG